MILLDWQPWLTAPKDGTYILVADPVLEEPTIIFWNGDEWVWSETGMPFGSPPIAWTYLPKMPLLETMHFEKWLADLDLIAKVNGVIGDSYTKGTGHECWVDAFNSGLSPLEAWQEDLSNASGDIG